MNRWVWGYVWFCTAVAAATLIILFYDLLQHFQAMGIVR